MVRVVLRVVVRVRVRVVVRVRIRVMLARHLLAAVLKTINSPPTLLETKTLRSNLWPSQRRGLRTARWKMRSILDNLFSPSIAAAVWAPEPVSPFFLFFRLSRDLASVKPSIRASGVTGVLKQTMPYPLSSLDFLRNQRFSPSD